MCTLSSVHFPPSSCAAPCDILYIGTGDMSIFVQIEDSRHPYLIREPLCCVCSSGRGRGNLSYFAGDRSQSSPRNTDNEKSDPALFSFSFFFFYFTEPFYEALRSKVQSLFQQRTFLHFVTAQFIRLRLSAFAQVPNLTSYLCLHSVPVLFMLKKITKIKKVRPVQVVFNLSAGIEDKWVLIVRLSKKKRGREEPSS